MAKKKKATGPSTTAPSTTASVRTAPASGLATAIEAAYQAGNFAQVRKLSKQASPGADEDKAAERMAAVRLDGIQALVGGVGILVALIVAAITLHG